MESLRVVERTNIDALIRERQIIRSSREEFNEDKALGSLVFAGIIIDGGVVGYDTNRKWWSSKARYLGIGHNTSYRRDSVIVSLRATSTLTSTKF